VAPISIRTRTLAAALILAACNNGEVVPTAPGGTQTAAAVPTAVILDASLCSAPNRPLWVGFQDDAGAWKQLTPAAGIYTASMLGAKGGLAVVSGSSPAHRTTLIMWTRAELSAAPLLWCGAPVNRSRTATVTVAGMAEVDESVNLAFGGGTGYAFASGVTTIDDIEPGPHDFFALRRRYLDPDRAGDRILIRRNLNPAAGASLGSINMTTSEALPLARETFTVPSILPGERLSFHSWYHFGASCGGFLMDQATVGETEHGGTTTFVARGVPASLHRAGDFHNMTLSSYRGGSARYSEEMIGTFSSRTLTLPSSLPAFTLDLVPGAHLRPRVQIAMPAESRYLSVDYSQSGAPDVSMLASAGWYGAGPVALIMPDLSGTPGWNNVWLQPAAASSVPSVYVGAISTNRGVGQSGFCAEGSYTRIATSISGAGGAALRADGGESPRPEMLRRFFPRS
jgi:hypothetical protein